MNKYEIIIILLVLAAMVGWCLAMGFSTSISTLETVIDKQQNIIQQLRDVDREKCVNLLLKHEI